MGVLTPRSTFKAEASPVRRGRFAMDSRAPLFRSIPIIGLPSKKLGLSLATRAPLNGKNTAATKRASDRNTQNVEIIGSGRITRQTGKSPRGCAWGDWLR